MMNKYTQFNDFSKIEHLSSSKIKQLQKYITTNQEYTKIKVNNDIYEISDFIMLQSSDYSFYVGKLHKIITNNGIKQAPFWPCIEIQLYIYKDKIDRDINGLNDQEKYDSISHYEVFKTDSYIKDYAENILCHCKLLSLQDYEASDQHSENSFFTRATYDFNTKTLNPPISEWEQSCICGNPMNPDQLYINCEMCNKWFHPKHCGINEEDVEKINPFFCNNCKCPNS